MRSARRRVSLLGLLQAAALLTVIFTFVTGFDLPYYGIELFSHFRLQYFVVSVLLLLAFSWLRHVVYVSALAAAVIFNAILVVPWYFSDAVVESETKLKLMHVNVQASSTEYDRLLEFVAQESPDMLFMQEVSPAWIEGTRELLEEYPFAYEEPRDGNFGIATFSKIPFDSVTHIDSAPLGYPSILAAVTIDDKPLHFISSHPTPPIGRYLFDARNQQLREIAGIANQVNGKLVLLGDLNVSIWCPRFRQLEESTGLKNARKGFGVLPTWPTFMPFAMIPIDHALVSHDISVLDIRIGEDIGSDHLPLIVTISF